MRRSAVWSLPALLVVLLAALTACGGGKSSSTAGVAKNITATPSTASIDTGQVAAVTATVTDANGNAATNPGTITFSSSNTGVATVTTGGAVCGGTWNSTNTVCTPGPAGTATITVSNGTLSTTVPVFVHDHIDRLAISPSAVNCKSQTQTAQLTAQALHNGADITSTVGPITWTSASTAVATVDTNGLVTAVSPGQGSIHASVSGVNSVPTTFITCPVQTIRIHVANATDTSFSLAAAATQQLTADVLDSAGLPVSVTLTWASSQPVVAAVSSTGIATAGQPGATSITASCFVNTCNFGLSSVYSNVARATVSGTSANIVFATGTGTTTLAPIDTTTNTSGAGITLPAQPNSLLVNPGGTSAFLGSSAGLMTLNTSTNAVSNDSSHPGTVLAISPDGIWVVVAGASTVFLVNTSTSSSTQTLNIAGATAAAFTPDAGKLFIAAGNVLWAAIPGGAAFSFPQPVSLAGATVLASGAFAYFGSSANNVLAVASCSSTTADTKATPPPPAGPPNLVATLPNGSAVLAVDSPGIDVITPNTTLAGCPPLLTDTLVSKDFGQGAFTAQQLIVLPDGSKAFVTSNLGVLLVYDVTLDTTTTIPLAGGAHSFTGGATLDSKSVYVGGSDNSVHLINVAAGTDVQIPLPFTPDLVAVRPK